jgi:hypothetical protein
MFVYCARFHEKYALPAYPIALLSYDTPLRPEPDSYRMAFPDLEVLVFRFQVIQLNRLDWRAFVNRPNPVASALMAKMRIAPEDRPKVKAECLRLLATLRQDRARMRLISGFIDTYLKLDPVEERAFREELGRVASEETRETVMEIVTSWMEEGLRKGREQGLKQGLEQGLEQGLRQGSRMLLLRLLRAKLGALEPGLEDRVAGLSTERQEDLGVALLDFGGVEDLRSWLDRQF